MSASADTAQLKALRQSVQMVFQNPYASLNPRKRIAQMLDEPLVMNTEARLRPNAASASPRCCSRSACGPSSRSVTRTCSPAASASASRLRGR